jgi:hypothetical protein
VFFELGREAPEVRSAAPPHAVGIGDLLRHTRLGERLSEYRCRVLSGRF